jgi:hypothetical protein
MYCGSVRCPSSISALTCIDRMTVTRLRPMNATRGTVGCGMTAVGVSKAHRRAGGGSRIRRQHWMAAMRGKLAVTPALEQIGAAEQSRFVRSCAQKPVEEKSRAAT